MPEVKRQTAYKCSIKSILEGEYIQRPGWDPNFVKIKNFQVSRVNVIGVIVSRDGNNYTLDDGTGQISMMVFGEQVKLPDVEVGDVIQLIGRPREYNQKRFVVPEVIKKIDNSGWLEYRKLELQIQDQELNYNSGDSVEKEKVFDDSDVSQNQKFEKSEPKFEENYASIILSTIKKLDKGDGANVNDIIKHSGLEKADKYIISLINEGEIFEIRTGRIKILE